MSDMDYFDEFAGAGVDQISEQDTTMSFLSLVQPGSAASANGHAAGTLRNSATDTNYGSEVEVIPLGFKLIWAERDSQPPYYTVGRYEPGDTSIVVDIKKPKPGARGFPEMTNHETGNKIEELFMYAVMVADHPEDGVLFFSPSTFNMKALRSWNRGLRTKRLPSGKIAPIFSHRWMIKVDLVQNPAKPNIPSEKTAQINSILCTGIVNKEMFEQKILPAYSPTMINVKQIAAASVVTEDESL